MAGTGPTGCPGWNSIDCINKRGEVLGLRLVDYAATIVVLMIVLIQADTAKTKNRPPSHYHPLVLGNKIEIRRAYLLSLPQSGRLRSW